jgi:hypothetical protein
VFDTMEYPSLEPCLVIGAAHERSWSAVVDAGIIDAAHLLICMTVSHESMTLWLNERQVGRTTRTTG